MADRTWKAFERRIARLLGTERIPVTGERNGADCRNELFCVQIKKRRTIPDYLHSWLEGIRDSAAREGKIGIVVMQNPSGRDLDSLVVLTLGDWIDLHGPCERDPNGGAL